MTHSSHKKLFWLNGASSGIGFAVAQKCAQNGASIILASRSIQKLEEKKQALLSLGANSVEIVEFLTSQF